MEVSKVSSQSTVPTKPPAGPEASGNDEVKGQGQAASPPQAPKPATDTVQISSVAKKMQQEAMETPAQTAVEASKGDVQARRLLAKEEEEQERKA